MILSAASSVMKKERSENRRLFSLATHPFGNPSFLLTKILPILQAQCQDLDFGGFAKDPHPCCV